MTANIGRLRTCRIGREEDAYGTKSTKMMSIPLLEPIKYNDINEKIENNQAYGVIEDNMEGSTIGGSHCEVTMKGIVQVDHLPIFLYGIMGDLTTTADSPVVGAYSHLFKVKQTNEPVSFSIVAQDPINTGADASILILGARMSSLTIDAENKGWLEFTASFIGKTATTTTETIVFVKTEKITSSMSSCKLAENVAGLGASDKVGFTTLGLSLERNVVPHHTIGASDLNKAISNAFSCSVTGDLLWESNEYREDFNKHNAKAIEMEFVTDAFITGTTPYKLTVTIPISTIREFDDSVSLDDTVTQNFTLKGERSLSEAKMIEATFVNDKTNVTY